MTFIKRDIDLYQISDRYTTLGNYSLKLGGEFLLNRLNIFFQGFIAGVYSFTSLANFLAGNYSHYQQAFGEFSQFQSNPNFGVYVQDEWKACKDLTFNLGLRYDQQNLPDPIKTDLEAASRRLQISACLLLRLTRAKFSWAQNLVSRKLLDKLNAVMLSAVSFGKIHITAAQDNGVTSIPGLNTEFLRRFRNV